jgi:uncharacterized protein YbjT (DUF2867 family)
MTDIALETLVTVFGGSGFLGRHGARQKFDAVHSFGAEAVALTAAAFGARLVHVSAIGADERSPSHYARSKAIGEKLVLAALPSAVILRPSILFGPEDSFFNRFASIARISPALPLIGGGQTLFQPIFAGDVAKAVVAGIEGPAQGGRIYELGGPEVRSFEELMRFMLATIERRRLLIPIPFALAKLQASLLQLTPRPLLTPDQVELLRGDNVVSEQAKREDRTIAALGTEPIAMESVVPSYLWRFRKRGQFSEQMSDVRDQKL